MHDLSISFHHICNATKIKCYSLNEYMTVSHTFYNITISIITITDTYVYRDFTYELQECVYFRQEAHTAAEQTPTPTYHTTTSHTISFKSRVSDLYRHIIMALILLYELYQLTTIFITGKIYSSHLHNELANRYADILKYVGISIFP